MDAGGSAELHNMRSPICSASEYVEELRRCIGDVLESAEFNTQGHTLTAALKSRFKGKGLTAIAMLASKLWQYTILTENDISMQIQDMKNIALKLGSLSYPLSDEYLLHLVPPGMGKAH